MKETLELGFKPTAVAGISGSVWLVGQDVLQRCQPDTGEVISQVPLPATEYVAVAAGEHVVAIATATGLISLHRSDTAEPVVSVRHDSGSPLLAAHGGQLWVGLRGQPGVVEYDQLGEITSSYSAGPLAALAADQRGPWMLEANSDRLLNRDRVVDLPGVIDVETEIAACTNSIWLDLATGLLNVGSWAGKAGPLMATPITGPARHLTCTGDALVGGNQLEDMFTLDASKDNDIRLLDTGLTGIVTDMAGADGVVWVIDGNGRVHLITL